MWRNRHLAAAMVGLLGLGCSSSLGGGDRVSGSGDVVTEIRPVADYERLVLAGEGRVLVGRGVDGEVEIETDENLLAHIETTVSDGTLTISTESDVDIDPSDGVTYRLGCPELAAVALTGAGSIELNGCTTTTLLDLELAGAGSLVAPGLEVDGLRATLPGAGSIEAAGRAASVDVRLDGAAEFDGADLRAVDGDVESSGVGAVTVWVTDQLQVRISGVGGVRYFGAPEVSTSITGVGSVEALGAR